MRAARFGMALLTVLLLCGRVDAQTIMPGADAWVTTSDIPPFVVRKASLTEGGAGLYSSYLGDHPDNVDAGAAYRDAARGINVGVRVVRQEDTTYLSHFLESSFRSHKTGRLLTESSVVERGGQLLLFYCSRLPNCEDRIYAWRSGTDRIVKIDAKAFVDVAAPGKGPDPRRTPCPEPTEVLDEYLDRYPSSLTTAPLNTDESAKQWLRDHVGLLLAGAELRLGAVSTATESMRGQALSDARESLFRWAQEREDVFGRPSAEREAERIAAIQKLPPDAQVRELEALRDQYRGWWTAHQNDPIGLPAP